MPVDTLLHYPHQDNHPGGAIMPADNPTSRSNTMPQQLRRAVYIHVSDLINAYNIDHARLEEELMRVKAEIENAHNEPEVQKSRSDSLGGVPTELDTFPKKRLQPPRSGSNMVVLVGKLSIVVDKHRVDGSRVRLAEVEVGDETGTVSLRARDDQIDLLQEIAEQTGAVVLRNCTLELYQGKHIRLAITKWGKMSAYPDHVPSTPPPPSKINRDRNFSLINLSAVASEMVEQSDTQDTDISAGKGGGGQGGRGYHSHQTGQRRQHQHRGSRGKQGPSGTGMQAPFNVSSAYSGGNVPHGYAGGFGGSVYYRQHRHDTPGMAGPQHHAMMHPQYDMQHRQMQQHHMYAGVQPSLHQHQHHLVPGVTASPSFEASFNAGSEVQINAPPPPMAATSFVVPSHQSGSQHGHQLHAQTSNVTQRSDDSSPGRMNPQAATFDPNATTGARYHHHHST